MITEDELAKWQGWVDKGYSLTPPKCGALIKEVRSLQAENKDLTKYRDAAVAANSKLLRQIEILSNPQ